MSATAAPEHRRRHRQGEDLAEELAQPAVPARVDAQHRDRRAHRRRQDDDDRAHTLLLGRRPQDGRGPRRDDRHRLDGAGARARDHDHRRGHLLRLERLVRPLEGDQAADQHHRHARATSTSRPRWSARCASSTARSPSSTRSPASSPSPRPSGGRRTSTASRGSPSSTRWTASGADFHRAIDDDPHEAEGQRPRPLPADRRRGATSRGMVDLVQMIAYIFPTTPRIRSA